MGGSDGGTLFGSACFCATSASLLMSLRPWGGLETRRGGRGAGGTRQGLLVERSACGRLRCGARARAVRHNSLRAPKGAPLRQGAGNQKWMRALARPPCPCAPRRSTSRPHRVPPAPLRGLVIDRIRQAHGWMANKKKPRTENREPRTENREPRTENREAGPGARSQEPGARSQEPGARSQEPLAVEMIDLRAAIVERKQCHCKAGCGPGCPARL
jgi:hypothetical protein